MSKFASKTARRPKPCADEVYYDVGRNVAVAMHAEMEFRDPRIPDPLVMRTDQINQLNPDLFKGLKAQVSSSKTPARSRPDRQRFDSDHRDNRSAAQKHFGLSFAIRRRASP